MFIILYEHKLLTGIILFFLLSSIICQIAAGVIYQNMISQTDNMSDTKNRTLNQCKEKYAGYYKLNGKMVNTDVFVDRFLQGICFLKIHLSHLPHISGQFMMLSVLVTGISVCFSLAAGNTLFQIIPYYLISILGLYLYFSISGIVDIQEKRRILKTNLTDYLENHYAPRLETERENAMEEGIKKREKYAKELFKDDIVQKSVPVGSVSVESFSRQNTFTGNSGTGPDMEVLDPVVNQYQEELENLLEEFFV